MKFWILDLVRSTSNTTFVSWQTCRVLLTLGLVMLGLAAKTELQKKRYKGVKGVKLILDSSLKTPPDVVTHLNKKSLSPWTYS